MKINEKFFNLGIAVLVVGVVGFLVFTGAVSKDSVIGMFAGIMFNVSIFLSVAFGLQFFQLTTKRDVQKEIFDEHNVAAAIYQGFIFLALAIVISKGIM